MELEMETPLVLSRSRLSTLSSAVLALAEIELDLLLLWCAVADVVAVSVTLAVAALAHLALASLEVGFAARFELDFERAAHGRWFITVSLFDVGALLLKFLALGCVIVKSQFVGIRVVGGLKLFDR